MTEPTTAGDLLRDGTCDAARIASTVHRLASVAVSKLRRRYRMCDADCDDLAQEVTLAAVVDDCAALRRASPHVPLVNWLAGVGRNLVRRRLRLERQIVRQDLRETDAIHDPGRDPGDASSPRTTETIAELLARLTAEQRRVQTALLAAGSERRAAEQLGTSRDHVHDVRRRTLRRLRAGLTWRPPDTADWARAAATHATARGNAVTAEVLRMYADGRTQQEIATELRLSRDAVRGRIHRARRRASEGSS